MKFFAKKILSFLLTALSIVTLTFFIMKNIPGDPFTEEKVIPSEILNSIKMHYGLHEPLWKQYINYLKSISMLDLGPSLKYTDRTVNEIILEGFPTSALLGIHALVLSLFGGIGIGLAAATRYQTWVDTLARFFMIIGISVPSFLIAVTLQYCFAIKLNWFPVARWGSWQHVVLPSIALSILPMAFIARLTRNCMIEILKKDFIKTAKAKGVSSLRILVVHALPNALIPVVSYLGPLSAGIMTGTFVIERVFGIPGLGQWLVNSINARDYSVILGITLFYSLMLLFAVLMVDIITLWIDPRIKIDDYQNDII